LICVLIGLILSFSVVIFVQSTGLYTGGFGALFQGIARLTFLLLSLHNSSHAEMNAIIYNILFYGLYLALNVPLAIFAYKKIGKQFAKLSITFVITTQVMGFV
jgi:uncharacterized membrane-anchored protein YitT (DUF2179 family)